MRGIPHIDRWSVARAPMVVLVIAVCGWGSSAMSQPARAGSGRSDPPYLKVSRVERALLEENRGLPVIAPSEPGSEGLDESTASGQRRHQEAQVSTRLPEGYVLAARPATFVRDEAGLVAHPVVGADDRVVPPLRLLPNQQLEMLEAVLGALPENATLLLTGRVTEFKGDNYLLVQHLDQQIEPAAPEPQTRLTPDEPPEDVGPAGEHGTPVETEPSAEEILRKLMEQQARREVVLPPEVYAAENAAGPDAATQDSDAMTGSAADAAWAAETMLIDRVGRILPDGHSWVFVFEDIGDRPANKPVPLLPGRLLESAIQMSQNGTRPAVFIVSGEITLYKGNNHLLLRKLLVRRDLGNIR